MFISYFHTIPESGEQKPRWKNWGFLHRKRWEAEKNDFYQIYHQFQEKYQTFFQYNHKIEKRTTKITEKIIFQILFVTPMKKSFALNLKIITWNKTWIECCCWQLEKEETSLLTLTWEKSTALIVFDLIVLYLWKWSRPQFRHLVFWVTNSLKGDFFPKCLKRVLESDCFIYWDSIASSKKPCWWNAKLHTY